MPKKKTPLQKRNRLGRALFFLFLAAALAVSLLPCTALLPSDPKTGASLCAVAVRALATAAIFSLLASEGALRLRLRLCSRTPLVVAAITLAFLVALNNFPFEVLLFGGAHLTILPLPLLLYVLSSLATAAFEESLFRGLLFPLVRARTSRTLRGELTAILSSSALFGLLHLVNLLEAPLPDTLLQVCYTFLIGILSALLFLFTDSLLPPVLFHALYNFGGLFLPAFGGENRAPLATVLITVALALATAAVSIAALRRFADGEAQDPHARMDAHEKE